MRVLKIAGTALAAVVVIAILLVIVGVPAGFLTSAVQARVEQETGYRLTIAGSAKAGLWPRFNVTLNDVTLEDAKGRDTSNRLTIGSVEADMTLASLWSAHPDISRLVINKPVLSVPLLRERSGPVTASSRPSTGAPAPDSTGPATIGRVTINDGTIVFFNLRDRVENRLIGIHAEADLNGGRDIQITGNARAGEQPLKFAIRARPPAPPIERQTIPVEITLEVPDRLRAPLMAKAEVRLSGSLVTINGVTGTLGDGAFNGWASVDIASKPLVKLDLDFQRLDMSSATAGPAAQPSREAASASWSNATFDLKGLNYVDAQARISAADLLLGQTRFAPASIEASVAGGVLRAGISNLGAYGGQASGQLIVDASGANPDFALTCDLTGVRALPLLRSAADFDKLDGKLQAKLALRSQGTSQRAVMSNISGIAFANFQDGAIRGLNVAQMIRSLASGTLSGWQEGREQTTDLTQLSASFRVDKGQATTGDLNLVGPLVKMTGAGTVDLPAKSLAFRVEPKLVMTTEGQGRSSDPVGLGIPVVIDGPWSEPRIYPEISGILDNPDAAYARLKEMGKGLFGSGGGLGSGLGSGLGGGLGNLGGSGSSGGGQSDQLGKLGETLGNLLQQGLSQGGQVGTRQSRGLAAPASPESPSAPAAPAAADEGAPAAPESAPMNDVLKQLFNR